MSGVPPSQSGQEKMNSWQPKPTARQWRQGDVVPVEDQPAGKTYITLLTESCTKIGTTLTFELMQTEGQSHDPLYGYKACVENYQAIGQGKNKKAARHIAAKKVLDQIIARDDHIKFGLPGRTKEEAANYVNSLMPELLPLLQSQQTFVGATRDDGEDGGDPSVAAVVGQTNVVGELNKICQSRKWQMAVFEVLEEKGEAIDKIFVMQCAVGEHRTEGEGRNKKTAKRLAAELMLARLRQIPDERAALADESLVQEDVAAYCDLLADAKTTGRLPDGAKRASEEAARSQKQRHREAALVLARLDLVTERPSAKLRLTLHQLSTMVTGLAPVYTLVHGSSGQPLRDKRGELQCLCQLQTAPVAVTCGHGATPDLAEQSAAHSMLHYLKIMNTQPPSPPPTGDENAPPPASVVHDGHSVEVVN